MMPARRREGGTRRRVARCAALLVVLVAGAGSLAPAALAARCSASTTSVNFGGYDVFAATDDTSTGTVSVGCVREGADPPALVVVYTVAAGTGSSNSFAGRTLRSGTAALAYNLYTVSNYTTIWGNGTSGATARFSGAVVVNQGNDDRTRTHTVYGRIPARQDVAAGAYSDSIVVTVEW